MDDGLSTPHAFERGPRETTGKDLSLPEYDVRKLVGGGREALIVHDGKYYRLRITSNNKLILTK
jgi:hemin uptake protein HemP